MKLFGGAIPRGAGVSTIKPVTPNEDPVKPTGTTNVTSTAMPKTTAPKVETPTPAPQNATLPSAPNLPVGGVNGAQPPAPDLPVGGVNGAQPPPPPPPPTQQPSQGGWLEQVRSAVGDWRNTAMDYNNQQARNLANMYRISGEDISNMMSRAANQRAGSGIMGGTEHQNLLSNLMGGLRQDVLNQRIGNLQNAWGENSNIMNQAAAANIDAMNAAQAGATSAQQNTMNLIAQAIMASPNAAAQPIQLLAQLLGLGRETTGSSDSTSESLDPTKKYEIIMNQV